MLGVVSNALIVTHKAEIVFIKLEKVGDYCAKYSKWIEKKTYDFERRLYGSDNQQNATKGRYTMYLFSGFV